MVEQAHVRQRHEEHHENGGRDGYDNRAVGPASRSLLANVCERELGRPSGPELEDVSHGLCHTVLSGAHLIISVASSPAPRLGAIATRALESQERTVPSGTLSSLATSATVRPSPS